MSPFLGLCKRVSEVATLEAEVELDFVCRTAQGIYQDRHLWGGGRGKAKEEVQGGAGPVGFWSAFWGALDTSPSGQSCSELKQPGISDLSPKPQPLAQEEGPATRIHVRVP